MAAPNCVQQLVADTIVSGAVAFKADDSGTACKLTAMGLIVWLPAAERFKDFKAPTTIECQL